MRECIHCNKCVFREKCTPAEKLFQKDKDEEECNLFIDINNFCNTDWTDLGEYGEYFWKEMSWYRFTETTIE